MIGLPAIIEDMWRYSSPMLDEAAATYRAASPHADRFFAEARIFSEYRTADTPPLLPAHHNPIRLMPRLRGDLGRYGFGIVVSEEGDQFLVFRSDADCAREWLSRLLSGPEDTDEGIDTGSGAIDPLRPAWRETRYDSGSLSGSIDAVLHQYHIMDTDRRMPDREAAGGSS